jgi:hypothetical protein
MAGPPIPPVSNDRENTARTVAALRESAAATLTAAIVSASGRPHSISEAVRVMRDVEATLNASRGDARYKEWLEERHNDKPHT